ncbi:hypothetical protein CRENBAI_025873 [Crenichthys baileyi]|uniref:Uncharacterized protein n=1 Tax=Crenichthys baileyi TaxID=28760 RepID=A0AAV9S9B0_9TELE
MPEEPLAGQPQPPQRRAGESPRGTTQEPQCRSPRELQRRAHRPSRQPSTPEQILPWTQRPETPGHITPPSRGPTEPIGPGPGKQPPGGASTHQSTQPRILRTTSTPAGRDTNHLQVVWRGGNKPLI